MAAVVVSGGPANFDFCVVIAVTVHTPDLPTEIDVRAAFNVQLPLTRTPAFFNPRPSVFAAADTPSEETFTLLPAFN